MHVKNNILSFDEWGIKRTTSLDQRNAELSFLYSREVRTEKFHVQSYCFPSRYITEEWDEPLKYVLEMFSGC